MPEASNRLYLYEALELRAEYDARIKTLQDCLPEARQNRTRPFLERDETGQRRPSPGFVVSEVREQLRALGVKRRKLNAAIQQVNFQHQIERDGERMTLSEALELRKELNEQFAELHSRVVGAAYQRVIYKEDRDIVEPNEVSYADSVQNLDAARVAFRNLNREVRAASLQVVVEFHDEAP